MSRTRWITDWFKARLNDVHGCADIHAHEIRNWHMFQELVTEEAKRIDAIDAAANKSVNVPYWLDSYMLELSTRISDPNLSDVERILANATLTGINGAYTVACLKVHSESLNEMNTKNAELLSLSEPSPTQAKITTIRMEQVDAMSSSFRVGDYGNIVGTIHNFLKDPGVGKKCAIMGISALASIHPRKYVALAPEVVEYTISAGQSSDRFIRDVMNLAQAGMEHWASNTSKILESVEMEWVNNDSVSDAIKIRLISNKFKTFTG